MNLLPAEAAERLRITSGTLANWRCAGTGPRFLKFSGRKILYPESELTAFERTNLVSSKPIEERAGGR
jgi:hypothetical protein